MDDPLAGAAGEYFEALALSNASKLVSPTGSFIIHRSNNLMLSTFSSPKSIYFVKRTTRLPSKCTWTIRTFRPEKVYTKTFELGISINQYSGSQEANRNDLMLQV